MKNFISMFLMTSLLLGGMTFTIGKMSVCAASKNRIETAQQKQAHLFGSAKNKLAATDPDFAQTMDNFIYGDVYSRGKLTDKQRELLTITALTASQTLDSAACTSAGRTESRRYPGRNKRNTLSVRSLCGLSQNGRRFGNHQ